MLWASRIHWIFVSASLATSRQGVPVVRSVGPSALVRQRQYGLCRNTGRVGDVSPKPQGRPAGRFGKLAPHMDLPTEIVRAAPDITLAELGNALEDTFDLHSRRSIAHCSEPGSHIKGLIAKERDRSALRRERGINRRQPRMRLELHRPVFIDETAVKTDLTRLRGRAPVGERLYGAAPFGTWGTQTFIAGLTHDARVAPG